MNDQNNSIFFRLLPPELRDQIYKDYLDAEIKSGTCINWNMSCQHMDKLASNSFMASQLLGLALTCKKIYNEFAPLVIGTFYIWIPRNTQSCLRVGMGGFNKKQGSLLDDATDPLDNAATGPLRLSNMHKCTIRVDEPESCDQCWLFLALVLSDERERAVLRYFDTDIVDQLVQHGHRSATQLKETVVDWCPLQSSELEPDETNAVVTADNWDYILFLNNIADVKTLEVVRLRSNYPAWFAEYLRKWYSTVRVILE